MKWKSLIAYLKRKENIVHFFKKTVLMNHKYTDKTEKYKIFYLSHENQ